MAVTEQCNAQLAVGAYVDAVEPVETVSSPLGCALRRVRRARFYGGLETAAKARADLFACKLGEEDSICEEGGGLSQSELDGLAVVADATQHTSTAFDFATEKDADPDEFLLRVRRMRAFVGADEAEAFVQKAMLSETFTASGLAESLEIAQGAGHDDDNVACFGDAGVVSDRGLSQAELDDLCISDGGLSQKELDALSSTDVGLTQAALDSLSVHHTICDHEQMDDLTLEPSSPSLDTTLSRIRRTRAFKGASAAMAIGAASRALHESDEVPALPSLLSPVRSEKKFSKFCGESPDGSIGAPSPMEQIATPQRKRRSNMRIISSPEPAVL